MSTSGNEVSASEFKAKCLELMENVRQQRTELVVTKRGKPMVKLVPMDEEAFPEIFGFMRDSGSIHGDILAPLEEAWNAENE